MPIPRLVDLDLETMQPGTLGNTISNMSFSKYLGPGLRIGTIQAASKELTDQWSAGGANHSGGMMAQHTSYVIARMIEDGSLDDVLVRLRRVYGERAAVLLRGMKMGGLPKGTVISGGAGGYFIWAELPASSCRRRTAEKMLEKARKEYGVHALPGSAFEVPGHERGWGKRFIRFSFSFTEAERSRMGMEMLHWALQDSQW